MTTYLWTGASNTDWSNPSNWNVVSGTNVTTATGVPGSADNVLIMSGNSLNQAGYTYNGDANAMNNAVKNMTPTLSGSTPVTVANVTLGGNGGPATLSTGSTPFTVTGTLQDPQSAGFKNAQGGSYSLQGTNIHLVHLALGTGGNVSYGTVSTPANVTVDWLSGAGQNDNGNNSALTVTKGYDVDSSGSPSFQSGKNGNNNWKITYADGAEKRYPNSCFLTGSMIRTLRGDMAVEDIRPTDSVIACVNGQDVARVVVWTGKAHVIVNATLSEDAAGYPVRIVKDALAQGLPSQDLLVTSEHCVFLDGKFVPVRMLVNGASIFYDTSITSYDHYHIETEEHSIITANGILTESYLDTGNRRAFRPDGSVVRLGTRALTWEQDAAAPLDVSRAFVEPHFHRVRQRAAALGLTGRAIPRTTTDDADLRLLTETGHIIRPTRVQGDLVMFMVPSSVRNIHILSRTSRPSEAIGPFIDDRRELGVLIGQIALYDSVMTVKIDHHLKAEDLSGWEARAHILARWTNGYARLPLNARTPNSIGMLVLQILAAGPYVVEQSANTSLYKA